MTDQPVTQESVNNARALVDLMEQMLGSSRDIRENLNQGVAPTDQMVSAMREMSERSSEYVDNMSSGSTQQSLESSLQRYLEINQAQQRNVDITVAMRQNLEKVAKGSSDITNIIGGQEKALKAVRIATKSIHVLDQMRLSNTQEYHDKMEKTRRMRESMASFTQTDTFKQLSGLQKLAVKTAGFGSVVTGVLDAVTAHPIAKMVVFVLKTLMLMYDAAKKVLQIIGFLANGAITATKKLLELMVGIPIKIAEVASEIGGKLRQETVEVFDQMAEDIKEKVDLNSRIGKSFSQTLQQGKDNLTDFYKLNTSLTRTFGLGAEGFKRLMTESQDLILQLGSQANFFGRALGKSTESRANLVRIQKALNASGEDLKNIAYLARSAGKGFMSFAIEVKNSIDKASKKFNVDSKQISATVLKLRGDFINFGHMTTQAISESVAELTQMGIEAEDIQAVFQKFDTFESAATAAANLSQAFGMNVDALRLIQAEDPREIFTELQNAMYNTGRSFDDLNRHERSLLAQHTGLSGKALKMMMTYTEMGMSYEEAMSKVEAEDPVNKQTAAIDQMTNSIKELNKTLQFKSPLEGFINGIKTTIFANSDLRKSVEGLSKAYESFYTEGLDFGGSSILKEAMEPFETIVNEIKDLFGGDGLKDFMRSSLESIGEFAKDIMDPRHLFDNSDNFAAARESIQNMFSFDSLSTGGGLLSELMKTGGKIIGYVVKGAVVLVDEMSKLFTNMIDNIDKSLSGKETGFQKIMLDYFGINIDTFGGIFDTMLDNLGRLIVKLPKLVAPLFDTLTPYFEKVAEFFVEKIGYFLKPIMYDVLAVLFDALPVFDGDEEREAANLIRANRSNERNLIKAIKDNQNMSDVEKKNQIQIIRSTVDSNNDENNILNELQKNQSFNRSFINDIKNKQMSNVPVQDVWLQTDTNDEWFAAKPGGLLDKLFGFYGKASYVNQMENMVQSKVISTVGTALAPALSPLSDIKETMKNMSTNTDKENKANTEALIREIRDLKAAISNRPVIVQGSVTMDKKEVGKITMNEMRNPQNSYYVDEASIKSSSMQDASAFT